MSAVGLTSEQFWNGAILESVETAIAWASNMTWKGIKPVIQHVTTRYEKNITVDAKALANYKVDWHPDESLPQWAITIGAI